MASSRLNHLATAISIGLLAFLPQCSKGVRSPVELAIEPEEWAGEYVRNAGLGVWTLTLWADGNFTAGEFCCVSMAHDLSGTWRASANQIELTPDSSHSISDQTPTKLTAIVFEGVHFLLPTSTPSLVKASEDLYFDAYVKKSDAPPRNRRDQLRDKYVNLFDSKNPQEERWSK